MENAQYSNDAVYHLQTIAGILEKVEQLSWTKSGTPD